MAAKLILSKGATVATLDRFTRIERNRLVGLTFEYTQSRTPTVQGTNQLVDPYLWNVNGYFSQEAIDSLYALYNEQKYLASSEQNPRITLEDTYKPIIERAPRLRATCPAPNNQIVTRADGQLKYYAKFYVGIVELKDFEAGGDRWRTEMVLNELEFFDP